MDKNEHNQKFEEGKLLAEQLERFYIKSEKNKRKRTVLTVLFYIIKNVVIIYYASKAIFGVVEWKGFIPIIVISIVISLFSYWLNLSIFMEHFRKSEKENETIERMKNRLAEISEELNLKSRYEVEDFLSNRHI